MGLHHSWKELHGTAETHRVCLFGSFDCNGASDPADVRGDLARFFDITHSATGRYLFTWKDGEKPGEIVHVSPRFVGDVVHGDTVDALQADDAADTFTIKTYDSLGDTDIPSGEAIRVQVELWVRCLVSDRV